MKQLLTLLMIPFCLTTFGQPDVKEVEKSFAKMSNTLYASKYEVSNQQYNDFIASLKKAKQTDLLAIARIDTLKWRDKKSYNEPYVEYYHSHPAYKNYPVVNITHEAAILFCNWLTNAYNSNPDRKYKKVLFRLPTEQEWISAAQGGDTSAIYPWKGTEIKDKKGNYLCNFSKTNALSTEPVDVTAPVNSYSPNGFGLLNMSGNVAEMVADKNIVKGGGWMDPEGFMRIDSKNQYDGSANPSVGFRYVVELIEK